MSFYCTISQDEYDYLSGLGYVVECTYEVRDPYTGELEGEATETVTGSYYKDSTLYLTFTAPSNIISLDWKREDYTDPYTGSVTTGGTVSATIVDNVGTIDSRPSGSGSADTYFESVLEAAAIQSDVTQTDLDYLSGLSVDLYIDGVLIVAAGSYDSSLVVLSSDSKDIVSASYGGVDFTINEGVATYPDEYISGGSFTVEVVNQPVSMMPYNVNSYSVTDSQLQAIVNHSWSTGDVDDPYVYASDFIYSIISLPFSIESDSLTSINIAGREISGSYYYHSLGYYDLDLGVMELVSSDFQGYLSEIEYFLPFGGSVKLNVQDVLNRSVALKLRILLTTGEAKLIGTVGGVVEFSEKVSIGLKVPLTKSIYEETGLEFSVNNIYTDTVRGYVKITAQSFPDLEGEYNASISESGGLSAGLGYVEIDRVSIAGNIPSAEISMIETALTNGVIL